MADLHHFSRFRQTPQTIVDGVETLGPWVQPSWLKKKPNDASIGVFRVNNAFEGRPDLIAERLYGSSLFDWVLIAFNAAHNNDVGARIGLNWPAAGATIIYPLDSIVYPELT